MRAFLAFAPAALALAGCASPDRFADPAAGGYDAYAAQREAQLTGAAPVTSPYGMTTPVPPGGIATSELAAVGIGAAPGAPPVATASFGAPPAPGVAVGSQGLVAVASSGVAGDVNMMRATGVEASPSNAAPVLVGAVPAPNATGISDEQDFDAVASRESIESDAVRRQQQAAQYQVIQPQALPEAPASTGPNIVQYALAAPNSVGQEYYSRFVFAGEGRQLRNCGRYSSPDEAQRDFLSRGGPDRDPRGLDPDGDGFACAWDPAPFRAAIGRG